MSNRLFRLLRSGRGRSLSRDGRRRQAPRAKGPRRRRSNSATPRRSSSSRTGSGTFTKPISTKNKEAQAFFDQGFQMMYAFAKPEAVRSFRESWKRDGDCAICYWGEAWAWGSYLNGAMTAEESPYAFAAAEKARALRDKATPKEQALIDAIAVRYVKEFRGDRRVDQDRAYAEAMKKVVRSVSGRSRDPHALRRRAVHPRAAQRQARSQQSRT